jgi:O-antigen/teichoic acid export membrane protein
MMAAALAVSGLAAILGKPILLTYGPGFIAGYRALLLLLLAGVCETLCMALFQRIQSRGRMWIALLGITLPSQAAFLAAAVVLAPQAGAFGLSAAYLAGTVVAIGCTLACVRFVESRDRISSQDPACMQPEGLNFEAQR